MKTRLRRKNTGRGGLKSGEEKRRAAKRIDTQLAVAERYFEALAVPLAENVVVEVVDAA